jgi:hypothetical protein
MGWIFYVNAYGIPDDGAGSFSFQECALHRHGEFFVSVAAGADYISHLVFSLTDVFPRKEIS